MVEGNKWIEGYVECTTELKTSRNASMLSKVDLLLEIYNSYNVGHSNRVID